MERVTLLFAFLSWAGLLALGFTEQSLNLSSMPLTSGNMAVKGLLLNAFIFNVYVHSWLRVRYQRLSDFFDFLWKIFFTAVLFAVISGLLNYPLRWLETAPFSLKLLAHSLIFHLEFGLMLWLMITTFAKWKKAVLFERSKFVGTAWTVFEYGLMATSITHFFHIDSTNVYLYIAYGAFLLISLVLSVNLRWIPRLTFRQKLLSVPMLLGIMACFGYFIRSMVAHFSHEPLVVDDISKSVFVASMLSFVLGYALISLLALLFNLPTASAFEQRFLEMVSFQQIYDIISSGGSAKDIYQRLLERSMDAGRADAGWVELSTEQFFVCKGIAQDETIAYMAMLKSKGFNPREFKPYQYNYFSLDTELEYRSIMAIPLKAGVEHLGTLCLLKRRGDGFDSSAITFVNTLSSQTSVAMQNLRLIEQAVQSEHFRSGIQAIAQLRSRLLPSGKQKIDAFDMHVLSNSEMGDDLPGGDYYDCFRLSENKYAFIIADVAGKGITASFTMAQMKGIFQALVRTTPAPNEFLKYANAALTGCLEKGVFVTATYFMIDTNERRGYFSRAGHCPTLFYEHAKEDVRYFKTQGVGLGIIAEERYDRFIEVNTFEYAPGDMLILYTDGVVEAANKRTGEEYGYDRLKSFVSMHNQEPLPDIASKLFAELGEFTHGERVADDHTIMLVRFK